MVICSVLNCGRFFSFFFLFWLFFQVLLFVFCFSYSSSIKKKFLKRHLDETFYLHFVVANIFLFILFLAEQINFLKGHKTNNSMCVNLLFFFQGRSCF